MSYQKAAPVDIVIDIETVTIPPTEAELEAYRKNWKPKGNVKDPEKIEAQRQEAFANIEASLMDERKFSIGGKRMISCALGTISHMGEKVVDIQSWASDDLSVITKGIVGYLDEFSSYNLVGWNHQSFDLPEIAKSFFKTGTRPRHKPSKWGLIDLCKHPFYRIGLKEVAKGFGLEVPDVTGDDVARMHAAGHWSDIRKYNESDVRITGEIYLIANTIFTF